MLKRFVKVSIVLVTLFYFGLNNINAYDFINPENESSVNKKIDDIYESKDLYEALFDLDDSASVLNLVSSNLFWWPIGSEETTVVGGVEFAAGEPQSINLSEGVGCFEWRADKSKGETCGWHTGQDIGGLGLPPGTINVIAPKDGVVIYPTSDSQTLYPDNSGSHYMKEEDVKRTGIPACGNQVSILHSDGVVSIFCHLAYGSIRVRAGDTVRQGQVVAKVGHSGSSTAPHLHYTIRVNGELRDPLDFVDPLNPRPMSNNSNFSLVTTTLSKEEFVARMDNYCERTRNSRPGFCNNFASKAESIYTVSLSHGVNPELVVVTAGTESGWDPVPACRYTNNYWGIGIVNGKPCNTGGIYSSLEDGIIAYAETLARYNVGGAVENMIRNRYNARSSAGCDPAGHGLPGTLEGMQSVYSWVGDYRYNPGDWNSGGCVYLNHYIYSDNYCNTVPSCTEYGYDRATNSFWANCSEDSKTTVCEQNDYTAFQLSQKIRLRYDIFGL